MFTVQPIERFGGRFAIPASKPETQRALLSAALSQGISVIHNALICNETECMMSACCAIGAEITIKNNDIYVQGVAQKIHFIRNIINCNGSALVFRVFSAIACCSDNAVTLTGNSTLLNRPMQPLFKALELLGACIDYHHHAYAPPCNVNPRRLVATTCELPADISSQYVTALLYLGVLLNQSLNIVLHKPPYSLSYIKQTVVSLKQFNAHISVNSDYTELVTSPSVLQSSTTRISGDFTSASYLVACALLFPGVTTFTNIDLENIQGEKIIFDLVNQLGIPMHYNSSKHELTIDNRTTSLSGNVDISVKNGPNITPTLAVIGAYVVGEFIVRDATVCQYHKCNRIETMIVELKKFGVDIEPILKNGVWDGFIIKGKQTYRGNVTFDSDFQDHRIIMSLFVLALRAQSPSFFTVANMSLIRDSFPDFMKNFKCDRREKIE